MIKSIRLIIAAFAVIGGLTVVSFAQEGEHKPKSINERQQNQRDRIKDGVQDGELTRRETGRLAKEQAQIGFMERRFRKSGDEFTNKEKARVQHQLNQSSRHIRRAKRN